MSVKPIIILNVRFLFWLFYCLITAGVFLSILLIRGFKMIKKILALFNSGSGTLVKNDKPNGYISFEEFNSGVYRGLVLPGSVRKGKTTVSDDIEKYSLEGAALVDLIERSKNRDLEALSELGEIRDHIRSGKPYYVKRGGVYYEIHLDKNGEFCKYLTII